MTPAKGDRIELVEMPEDPCPIEPGAQGTVRSVTDLSSLYEKPWTQVCVDWDNGRGLNLSMPPDRIKIITKGT